MLRNKKHWIKTHGHDFSTLFQTQASPKEFIKPTRKTDLKTKQERET